MDPLTIIKELGSFGVIVWLLLVEIPQFRAAIQEQNQSMERITQMLMEFSQRLEEISKGGCHEHLPS